MKRRLNSVLDGPPTWSGTCSEPDHYLPNEKKDESWLLNVAKNIYDKFARSDIYGYRNQMYTNFTYWLGKYDTAKFKTRLHDVLGDDQEETLRNLDYTPLPVLNRIMAVHRGLLQDMNFVPNVEARNDEAVEQRKTMEYQLKVQQAMASMLTDSPMFMQMFGNTPMSQGDSVYQELGYKQAVELAFEEAIRKVMSDNSWQTVKAQMIENFQYADIAGVRILTDKHGRVIIRDINPFYLVVGKSSDKEFSTNNFFGVLEFWSISDLRQLPGAENVPEQKWQDLSLNYRNLYGNPREFSFHSNSFVNEYGHYTLGYEYDKFRIPVLSFNQKSWHYLTHEVGKTKYDTVILSKRSAPDYKPRKRRNGKVQSAYEVWYKGIWPISSEFVLDGGLVTHQARGNKFNKSYSKAYPDFVVYSPNVHNEIMEMNSPSELSIPYVDQVMMAHLNMQNTLAAYIPPGFAIDTDSLVVAAAELKLKDPFELIKFFKASGVITYTNKQLGENTAAQLPVLPLDIGLGREFSTFISLIDNQRQQIREAIGIPAGLDATPAPERQLVGALRSARFGMTKNLTKYGDGIESITLRMMKVILGKVKSTAINEIMEGRKSPYLSRLDMGAAEAIRMAASLAEADLHLSVKPTPTEEEMEILVADIQIALSAGQITIADKLKIQDTMKEDLSKASAMLQMLITRNQVLEHQRQLEVIEQTTAQQQASAEQAAQMDMQKEAAKASLEQEKIILEHRLEMERIRLEMGFKDVQEKRQSMTKITQTAMSVQKGDDPYKRDNRATRPDKAESK